MVTGFNLKSGLLEKKHRDKIGTALWEFLWCIDRTTKEFTDDEGVKYGIVLNGRPILADEIAETFGTHPETVKKNLRRLADHGYLQLKRTYYGNVIKVAKSGKWKPKEKPQPPPVPLPPDGQTPTFITTYGQEFGRPITPTEIILLRAFIDNDGLLEELVCEAIKRARLNNVLTVRYVEKILVDWRTRNIRTMDQVVIADAEFEKQKSFKSRDKPPPKTEPPKSKNSEMFKLIYRN